MSDGTLGETPHQDPHRDTPQPEQPPLHVGIIGGGLSGLATAVNLHLLDPTIKLTLLERSDRVGGVIHTQRHGDLVIDHGADMFSSSPPDALELCEVIGVDDKLINTNDRGTGAMIVSGGRLVPIPDGFVLMRATKLLPILTTPLLSLSGKFRLLVERWVKDPRGINADEDQSVADFVRHRLGDQALQKIVGPLVAGIYTADIEKLSMKATMGPIAKMVAEHGSLAKATSARRRNGQDQVERASTGARYSQFRAFPGGMIEFIQSLASFLPPDTIRLNSPVQSLEKHDGAWLVHSGDDSLRFDELVVATPSHAACKLLGDVAPEAASELSSIEYSSTAIVVMVVPRASMDPIRSFGIIVPPAENRRILACSFASQKFAGRAPDDQAIVRIFIGGSLQSELLALSDDELIDIAKEELGDLMHLRGEPSFARVVRWNDSMPQYHVGHLQRVERIEKAIAKHEGLTVITNALRGVGIAPVCAAAKKAAKNIVHRRQRQQAPQ